MKMEPLKTAALRAFAEDEALGAREVYERLKDRYPGERYCSPANVAEHLKSLKAVGMLTEEGSYLDDAGELVSVYKISQYGLAKLPRKTQ